MSMKTWKRRRSDDLVETIEEEGIAIIVPTKEEQGYIQDKLFSEVINR